MRQIAETSILPWKVPMILANAALDYLFYDTPSLTPEETAQLLGQVHHEGAVLVVESPRGVKGFDSLRQLKRACTNLPKRWCVAGVGSSALGAAALARNLANATGEPVGAIVAGYGMLDLVTEALGGWFLYGVGNRWHQRVDDFLKLSQGIPPGTLAKLRRPQGQQLVPRRDDEILQAILEDPDFQVEMLLGHSKGCLSIAETLFRLASPPSVQVVTVGAVCEFPPGTENVHQFLGSLDGFGGLNSRWGIGFEPVIGAWHHLNTSLPFHCDLTELLKKIRN